MTWMGFVLCFCLVVLWVILMNTRQFSSYFFSSSHKELLKEHSNLALKLHLQAKKDEIGSKRPTLIKFAHLCRLRVLFSPEKAVHYHFRSSRHHTKKFRFALLMLTILLETDSMVSSLAFFLCHYVVKVFLKLHLS